MIESEDASDALAVAICHATHAPWGRMASCAPIANRRLPD
jgi:Holliday junction resolvasome RuvABC endonuclease subunit